MSVEAVAQDKESVSLEELFLQSCNDLREDVKTRCVPAGPSTSIQDILMNRDVAKRGPKPMSDRTQAYMVNTYLPNRKKRVDKVATKTFCAQYVQGGRKLVVASQGKQIGRFK